MPHQSIMTFAPFAATLLMTSTSRQNQAETYPNKLKRVIRGFALGGGGNAAAIILHSKSGVSSITLLT